MKKSKETKGITLIALVVTIVVLIILATISINAVLGENGIIKRAEAAKRLHEQGVTDEQTELNELDKYLGNKLNGVPEAPITPDSSKEPNEKPLVNKDTVNKTEHGKIVGEDKLGNPVVVPNGFKVSEESGDNVEDGIIIEDTIGNQFVWVPVSNIDGDGVVDNQTANGLITRKDGSKVQITLGRYTFATTSPGTPTLVQKGIEYDKTNDEKAKDEKYKIADTTNAAYCYEFSISRNSNFKSGSGGTNATALNLKGFIESVRNNYGYYIARYEASYGSGNSVDNYKPLSQKSKYYSASKMNLENEKTLWNFITQGSASRASRNMYAGNAYVESDLVNSYMWDTAIVYIQAMGNENYANAKRKNVGKMANTGTTEDEKCHIFDMAENLFELTTEYNTATSADYTYPCSHRGGYYNNIYEYPAYRYHSGAGDTHYTWGFRVRIVHQIKIS